jgi:RNA polymerase sigma-70 factor (ECF subfamily)
VASPVENQDAVVQRMLRGDDDAFRVVYRSLHPRLLRYLSALVGPGDAEDVGSETWGQVCRDLQNFSGDADGFRGWVTTIGRNRALDHLRAQGRRPSVSVPIEDMPERPSLEDVESVVDAVMSTESAIALISSLPREQAEAVLLRAVMGLDAKTAGKILGRSAGAVRTSAYRGLKTLATRLEASRRDERAPVNAEEVR